MWPSPIVVFSPFSKQPSQVPLTERNEPIQALSPQASDQPFAKGIRFWCSNWSLENSNSKGLDAAVQIHRENTRPIADQPTVSVVTRDGFPELLQRPGGVGMRGCVYVQKFARAQVHDHEYVENLEPQRHCHGKVAGHHRLGVVSHEGHPALGVASMAGFQFFGSIGADRPWRNVDAEFQSQFRCDPALTPGGVLSNHLRDECAKVPWNSRSSATRFPTPEKLRCFPVPANERLWLHHHKSVPPSEAPGKKDKCESVRVR